MPTVLDVDEIHTPEYEQTTLRVEEEHELAQELKQPKEDAERTESTASRGKGLQQEESATSSMQQGLEPEPEHETKQEVIPEGGVSSPQGKRRHEQRVVGREYNAYRRNWL
jgi:hypothetical protein